MSIQQQFFKSFVAFSLLFAFSSASAQTSFINGYLMGQSVGGGGGRDGAYIQRLVSEEVGAKLAAENEPRLSTGITAGAPLKVEKLSGEFWKRKNTYLNELEARFTVDEIKVNDPIGHQWRCNASSQGDERFWYCAAIEQEGQVAYVSSWEPSFVEKSAKPHGWGKDFAPEPILLKYAPVQNSRYLILFVDTVVINDDGIKFSCRVGKGRQPCTVQ
ncbi:hypothetical protein [Eoetvoesiella caeni]